MHTYHKDFNDNRYENEPRNDRQLEEQLVI